jgi:hypothetical protein
VKFSHHNTRLPWPGVVFIVISCLILSASAQTPKSKSELELILPMQSRDSSTRGPNGIQYVRPGEVAVWYSEKNSEGSLSRRDKLNQNDPWQLKMQVVNTSDGAVKQKLQWPTRKNSSAFVVQSDGKPVLLTGPVVHCFSPEFRETRSFTLKNAGKPKEFRILRASPGGSIVWVIEVSSNAATATRIDASNCKPGSSLSEPRNSPTLSGNDDQLVETNPKQVGLWSSITGWKLIYQHECCLSNSRFVAPNLVGLIHLDLDIRRHFLLINLQGQLLLDDPMEQGWEFGDIYTSADARTAAVLVTERDLAGTPTGIEVRKSRAKLRFYDLASHKRIANLELTIPGEHLFGIAIAPDSSEFAVLNGSKLSLYPLRH